MSTSDAAADAALEASVTVADEIEVAGDRTPNKVPDPDLDLDLVLNRLEPAGPGSPQHEQHQQSHDYQDQGQHVQEGHHQNGTPKEKGDANDSKRSPSRRGSHGSSANDSDHHGSQGSHGQKHERKGSGEGGSSRYTVPSASFPPHNSPRAWLLTQATSPLAIRLIRLLLAHGDYVAACLPPQEIDHEERGAEFKMLIYECKSKQKGREGWDKRIRGIRCDGKSMGQCSAAIAEAVDVFGRIDILLCCKFEAVVGTVEELSTTPATQNLVRDQFETIYFSQINLIKAALPQLRGQHTGHILILTSIGGHIGTPGMSIHTAATWALEGFCDSLAYEIAPFNIKVTIVQPNKEIQTLTNKIIFAPQLEWYESELNPAPSMRDILSNMLNANPDTAVEASETETVHRYPKLPATTLDKLVQETVHALTAIGGHENPPARHIVGFEGAFAVKEKLKTVTEELEDFVEASVAVDIFESQLKDEARRGKAPQAPAVEGMEGMEGMAGLEGMSGLDGMAGLEDMAGLEGLEGLEGMEGLEGLEGMGGMEGMDGMGESSTNMDFMSM